MRTTLLVVTMAALLGAGQGIAGLRADWRADTEPPGTSFGGDGEWGDATGKALDQWTPTTTPSVVSIPGAPGGVNTADPGTTRSVEFDGTDAMEMSSMSGTAVFLPGLDRGDLSLVLFVAPGSLTGGRQVLFECGGAPDGVSLVLIDNLLTFTVSQQNGSSITMQTTVDLTGTWAAADAFLRVTACIDLFPATGDKGMITLDASDGVNHVSASGSTADVNFTDWCGAGMSGLGRESGSIGGDLGGAVTSLSGGGAFGTFLGHIARVLVYDEVLCSPPLDPTVTGANAHWWSTNLGWINCAGAPGTAAGLVVGELFCSGWVWSSSVGWLCLGDGAPADGIRYGNTDGEDFGVNVISGALVGYAWAPSIGWINFGVSYPAGPDSDAPRIDLLTGETRGYAWSSTAGWINLGEGFAGAETGVFAFLDTDGDGISDAWERDRLANASMADDLSLVAATPTTDSDGDGRADVTEFNEDTDPFDSGDRFRLITILPDTPSVGTATVDWSSRPTRVYRRFLADDLVGWLAHGPWLVGDPGGTSSETAPLDPASKVRDFVRVGAKRPLAP